MNNSLEKHITKNGRKTRKLNSSIYFKETEYYSRRCVKKDLAVIYVKECSTYVFL